MDDLESIRKSLQAHKQEQLLAFFDDLSPDRRQSLLDQIASIDFDEMAELIDKYVLHQPETDLPENIQPPEITPARPHDEETEKLHKQAMEKGLAAIRDGKVAAFVVAGGQGTRLGYEGPKGCLPATPVAHKPLFQVFGEQILAAGRKAGVTIPWYVMTSPVNDVVTRAFFRQNNYFGLEEKDVFFLVQGMMPAVDFNGKIMLRKPGAIAMSPNGHGGSLPALRRSGALDDMAGRGIEYISYFQVDNPLVRCIDPLFIGLHALRGAEMSIKVLPKRSPMEKLGNVCVADGDVTVVEYSDMPEELARECNEDGRLKFSAGSIAIHVFSREFVERLTRDGKCELPWHRAEKKVTTVDSQGRPVEPDEPNGVKLEMFVFDALPLAKETAILETIRSDEFSPIKNAEGEDSPATSLHDQVRRAAEWLEEAGIDVPRDADGQVAAAIEISPLYANDPGELAEKIDENLEISPGQSVYLGSRGQTGGLK
jgi:UDP-N-acetylglucosamine/UDP-N-acetylgalactosamine diphosphorylase